MNKLSPAFLTLLVFLLVQGFGIILAICIRAIQGLPSDGLLPVSHLSLILMIVNVLAVLCCHLFLHNIHFATTFDYSTIRWDSGLLAITGGFLGAICISILTESMEIPDIMLQTSIAMSHNIWGLLTLTIIGPIAEELLFREAIVGEMLRRGARPWTAIIVSAVAFSCLHFNPAQVLYALPLGIIFGIIYYKTGNIVLTSILHILNNYIVVAQLRTMSGEITEHSLSEWFGGGPNAYAAMLCSGVLCIALMKGFWDRYQPRQKDDKNETYSR